MIGFWSRPDSETVVILAVVVTLTLLIAPVIGIRRADVRRRRGEQSTSAVVLASVAAFGAVAFALTGALRPLYAIGIVLGNLAWLRFALQTNRSVARRSVQKSAARSSARN